MDLQAPTGHLHSPLRKAAHRLGFCYVAGHGHVRELFARMPQAARRLFALAQVKNDPDVASRYGYVPRYRAG
ncbi:hypothetical protein MGAST_13795 [Mycobacterium gastri 'Wayne']|uniref:Non-haem dioxygenase N-terminal domain-containing protein n=1 Tax=Mycobacterium gastri TaxID=1777 RepID=A0A1X1V4V8_MYCGS|nr:hypothetical protein MGAST_13795 [Mycobacterium gastri 'Wayne']ORV64061.1 hypothetical protein AWC07_14750 [Mycobacterium gastri]